MATGLKAAVRGQQQRNQALLEKACYLGEKVRSKVLPLQVDISNTPALDEERARALEALQIQAARTAVRSLAELARINEVDHLGGGLELIPSFLLTLAVSDYEKVEYTIEHAHTSVGYYASLAALGFIDEKSVIEGFRRGLDVPGHVSWLPGGTQLNGGRLGVMVPVAVGQALGRKALVGEGAWVLCHCGDAGYISGQGLNGFNGADVHGAPITFIMHRNGIQLSGSTQSIMDKDPRAIVEAMGVEVVEIETLHDVQALYGAYREAYALAQRGRPSLIYPVGYRTSQDRRVDLRLFGRMYGIEAEVEAFALDHGVDPGAEIWIPGSLMSFRDVRSMIECVFLVNRLPGGHGHHDGHMKGRDADAVLASSTFRESEAQKAALERVRAAGRRQVTTRARPAVGSANLVLKKSDLKALKLPGAGEKVSPRAGSEAGYALVAKNFPGQVFVVSCDLDPSTKLEKARSFLAADHQFEMSIEEQAATLVADGLAMSSYKPQLNVVSTFAAFYEGIAREGFDMWRYQRNLTGVNEGLNVCFHISHVGACTGRDHFSGWGLDWINIGLTYLPYLHRFYAPADARSAFLAVRDLAAHYGGHIIGIPRDNLPVLDKADGSPLWEATDEWQALTTYRAQKGAKKAILALGAPAFLGGEAAQTLKKGGVKVDVHVVSGLPLPAGALKRLLGRYPEGVVTVEDGFIGTAETGARGFAGLVATEARALGVPVAHVGITDPRTAPAEGHMETWDHFGISARALVQAIKKL